jgi:hypothetical protein
MTSQDAAGTMIFTLVVLSPELAPGLFFSHKS